jgi:DNA-directed RNA polymerase specialized sigma24 family protein
VPEPGPRIYAEIHGGEPATALIAALAIEIDAILSHFRLSERDAEDLLREILLLAVYRWDAVDSRELWLLATLRRACLRRLQRQASHP